MNTNKMTEAPLLLRKAGKYLEIRALSQALLLFDAAQQAGAAPETCGAGRWTCHMLRGDYEAGWQESDAIAATGAPDPHRFSSGSPLAGSRLLIRCLHGLGDTIQYVRYADLLRPLVRHLTIEAQPPLKELLAQADLADAVITWGDAEPSWDQQIEIVELPRIFRSQPQTLPARIPYLRVSSAWVAATKPRIGLLWASGAYDPTRSIPFPEFARIAQNNDCDFFSFQADPDRQELLSNTTRIMDVFDPDLVNVAQRLETMDLVITVDTMLAHLAGALGLAVWTLLPYAADWRWMIDRSDTPWYPTMRLFRQPSPGAWPSVVNDILSALKRYPDLTRVQVLAK